MKNLMISSLAAILMMSFSARAEDSTSSLSAPTSSQMKIDAENLLKNKKFTDDREITDIKLKADSGSLSKYSLKFNLSYYGPTFGNLSAREQPNPDNSSGPTSTALSGTIGMRYRTSSQTAFSLGTGLKSIHPLQGSDRTDVSTPYLNYEITSRTDSGIQMRNSFGGSYVTLPEWRKVGEVAAATYDFASIYNFGSSGFAAGIDGNLNYYFYDRSYIPTDKTPSRGSVQVFPTVKYNISDKLNVTTSTTLTWISPRDRSNETILLNRTVSQRLGLGYAITREIYIFPYATILPSRLAWDMTSINMSTSFSIL